VAATAMPELDSRVTKIAQSDTWTALARVASVVGTCILVPIGGWVAYEEWQNSVVLSSHSGDINTIKDDVKSIRGQEAPDHDAITILKTQMENVVAQIQKLWDRPAAPPGNKPQQP